jgi:hypothetical protein
MSTTKRVHIRSAVNAGAVSKNGGRYTIRGVCGAVDDIVMNGLLYPADELARGAPTLEDKPAPAGHPKNAAGQFISANSGEALLTAYAGAVCRNARHEGGRTLTDIVINEAAAKAHPDGAKLIERLEAAIAGTNAEPIHVSTGLMLEAEEATGESRGKKYQAIARNLRYDHLAILLNERGAGTPEQGVGMFLNSAGAEQPVEVAELSLDPEDRRSRGLAAWLNRAIFRRNASAEMSFDAIRDGLWRSLRAAQGDGAWVTEVFDRYAVWVAKDGALYRQDYAVGSDGSVAFSGTAEEVRRVVTFERVGNVQKEHDTVKDKVLAALNAAGIKTEGMDEAAMLAAYQGLAVAPVQAQLTAANSKIAEHEAASQRAEAEKLGALAAELAANSQGLTAEDFKAMGLKRCEELKAKAAPVITGNSRGGSPADEFAGYSLNSHLEEKV